MYNVLGLTSLDQVISNRKLRWAGHVRRMDWSRLPRKFLTSWVDAPRCRETGTLLLCGHDVTCELQLIGFDIDRAAVQLGVWLSWGAAAQDREKWRKLAAWLPLAPVETKPISEQAQTERTQPEHWTLPGKPGNTRSAAGGSDATTWSDRLQLFSQSVTRTYEN
jgi:hypothetical protein